MAAFTADDSARSSTSSPPSPGPSASQVYVTKEPSQFSQVLSAMDKMASFLGMTDDSPSCLRDMVKSIVRDSLTDELNNLISPPLPPDVPVLVVGDGGESSGVHLTTNVEGGVEAPPYINLDMVDSLRPQEVCLQNSPPPDTSKRIPKDLKGKVKRSRTVVVGDGGEVAITTAHLHLTRPTVVESDCCHNYKAHSFSQPNVAIR